MADEHRSLESIIMTNITNGVTITMTNAIQTAVETVLPGADILSSAVRQVSTMGNEMLFVVFLIGWCKLLKWMPTVYNELIPVLSVLGSTIVYPSLFGFNVPNVIRGFGLGFIPVGIHQVPIQIGKLKDRFKMGDTQQIKKPDVPASDKPTTP